MSDGPLKLSDEEFWFDGRHVNEAGAARKAALFAAFLVSSELVP